MMRSSARCLKGVGAEVIVDRCRFHATSLEKSSGASCAKSSEPGRTSQRRIRAVSTERSQAIGNRMRMQARSPRSIRIVVAAAAVFAAAGIAGATALAQTYPTQRIQILVPFSAGTVLDNLARVAADRFAAEFGQPVVVVNKPGASGVIAFGEVAAAQRWPYADVRGPKPAHCAAACEGRPALPRRRYRAGLPDVRDAVRAGGRAGFAASRISRISLTAARANPGTIRFGHSGPAATPHLFGTLLAQRAGFRMADIPIAHSATRSRT